MGRFKPGQSGNPAGRPKGRGMAHRLRAAIAEESEDIIRVLVGQALAGDTTAAKVLLDRVLPPMKAEAQAVRLNLEPGGLVAKADAIIEATGAGVIAPDVAAQLISAVATLAKITEVEALEERLTALEQQLSIKAT